MARRDWYCEDILSGKLDVQRVYEDDRVLASVVDGPAIQATATSLGLLDGEGFYVRANAAAPGATPHMHWHVLGPGAGADWPGWRCGRVELAFGLTRQPAFVLCVSGKVQTQNG